MIALGLLLLIHVLAFVGEHLIPEILGMSTMKILFFLKLEELEDYFYFQVPLYQRYI